MHELRDIHGHVLDVEAYQSNEGLGNRPVLIGYLSAVLSTIPQNALLDEGRHSHQPVCAKLRGDGLVIDLNVGARSSDLMGAHLRALCSLALPVFDRQERGGVRLQSGDETADIPTTCEGSEHVFTWSLPNSQPVGSRGEYLAQLLSLLLDVVDLQIGDREVFRPAFIRDDGYDYPLEYEAPATLPALGNRKEDRARRLQPLQTVAATEPAIIAIARHWALLAKRVTFEDDLGTLIPVGIRLRSNSDWIVKLAGHPSDVYEYLARICNVSCKFCYLYGNPDSMAIGKGTRLAPKTELQTRLKYFDPEKSMGLFRAQWEINEALVDPHIFDLLPEIRKKTKKRFFFITNGSPLRPQVVDLLAEVAPVDLIVSLNDIDPEARASIMNEKPSQTQTALASLALLADREIPFGVSLAAFPDFPLDHLEFTIRAAQEAKAAFVRVNLPGYTRNFPADPPFDTAEHWAGVVSFVRKLRASIDIPIITIPSAFEENFFQATEQGANIIGTVMGSPAHYAGLKPYDVIYKVDNFDIECRSDLINILLLKSRPTKIGLVRSGESISVTIDPTHYAAYPYAGAVNGKYIFPLGIVTAPSIAPRDIRELERQADGAERPLIVSSPIMTPEAQRLVKRHAPELFSRLRWTCAENDFLGGNIRIMDMCTIGDISAAIDRALESGGVDRILLPDSGFNTAGRDISGRHWMDLVHHHGVDVRLFPVRQFAF